MACLHQEVTEMFSLNYCFGVGRQELSSLVCKPNFLAQQWCLSATSTKPYLYLMLVHISQTGELYILLHPWRFFPHVFSYIHSVGRTMMVQNSVQNIATPALQLYQPCESFDTSLSIICATKLNEFNYLHMKWFHIMIGSFKTKGHTLVWRSGWGKNKRKDISRWGREEICYYVRK